MGAGLIDPLNEDTYDDRVIVHSSIIKSHSPTPAYRKGWERIWGSKRATWSFTIKVKKWNVRSVRNQ